MTTNLSTQHGIGFYTMVTSLFSHYFKMVTTFFIHGFEIIHNKIT
jgi:hypothetical protein